MSPSNIATAADYADAMITARRAKNWVFVLLLLMLMVELGAFFTLRYSRVLSDEQGEAAPAPRASTIVITPGPAIVPASQPAGSATAPAVDAPKSSGMILSGLHAATLGISFLGVILVIVMGFILLLIVKIMLVGRLIGVSRLTSAYIWCIILAALIFPWQSFFRNAGVADPAFQVPGVLYTWDELHAEARFGPNMSNTQLALRWARYVAFPVAAIIMLLVVQAQSSRGLRLALGEAEAEPADVGADA